MGFSSRGRLLEVGFFKECIYSRGGFSRVDFSRWVSLLGRAVWFFS